MAALARLRSTSAAWVRAAARSAKEKASKRVAKKAAAEDQGGRPESGGGGGGSGGSPSDDEEEKVLEGGGDAEWKHALATATLHTHASTMCVWTAALGAQATILDATSVYPGTC